ncbi:SDR family NAD(P)-dependent oxidoreductase [Hazenella sp. IB182353]|uniref:SDR family oxidoreductase n=1 Tax=Polycladospora coralii TaxID=2771432 RepID=UPI001745E4B5|nr:SDR family NAD(P)-dependent oxidoreductase [Polycladospora coralii]MBS7529126.1 SDR family NAD(P)-dependent oxidoreductase [Polycladospora coralii]
MQDLTEKVAIVTGASRGLGKAICKRLAEAKVTVIAAARSFDDLKQLTTSYPDQITPIACDVTDPKQVENLIHSTMTMHKQIDILINNAGIGRFAPVDELSTEDFSLMLDVNLKGTFFTCKYSIPHLKKSKGHILNISSIAGIESFASGGGYCASKFGVMALSDALRMELKSHHVKVSTFCPGSIKTDFGRYKDYALEPEQVAESIYQIVAADPGVIMNQVVMRPLVP